MKAQIVYAVKGGNKFEYFKGFATVEIKGVVETVAETTTNINDALVVPARIFIDAVQAMERTFRAKGKTPKRPIVNETADELIAEFEKTNGTNS